MYDMFDYDTWLSTPPEYDESKEVDEDIAYDRWVDENLG